MYTSILWIGGLLAALAGIYGLHRLGLHLEARGLLYYWHKKPSGGAASAFQPLHEITQPQIRHVREVAEQRLSEIADDEGAGEDGPVKPLRAPGARE